MSGSSNFLLGRSTPTPQPNISHATAGPTHTTAPPSLVLAKDEALQKAIQEYIGKISNDDKEAFRNAPDIIERLQEMQCNKKPRIPSSFTTRVENVLQCVRCFMSSLAIFIQQSPEISSLVVGGVNCILTVSTINTYYTSDLFFFFLFAPAYRVSHGVWDSPELKLIYYSFAACLGVHRVL